MWSIAGFATGFVGTLLQLQICRAVLGAGEAFNWPVAVGVVRRIIPRLGERKALVTGLMVSTLTFLFYGLAPAGWMLYFIITFGAFGGIAMPATQGLLSKAVPPNEQGMLQGGLASLTSVTNVIGPLIGTNLFGYFNSDRAPVKIPGAAFFFGSYLLLVSLLLTRATFKRLPAPAA